MAPEKKDDDLAAELVAKILGSKEKGTAAPTSEEIEETVLRALRRYGFQGAASVGQVESQIVERRS